MSKIRTREWLLSQRSNDTLPMTRNKGITISITGGKGGIGKTSLAIGFAKAWKRNNEKILLIDCDFNLSNTTVKLGLPVNNDFYDLINGSKKISDCIRTYSGIDILPACNGNIDLFDYKESFNHQLIEILSMVENKYDKIILDCPAGLSKEALAINAYSDHRFIIVTPDRSSITDSYSLIKILEMKYGIHNNHLLINKVENKIQFSRIVKSMTDTVGKFLNGHLFVLGQFPDTYMNSEQFDQAIQGEKTDLCLIFDQLASRFSDEALGKNSQAYSSKMSKDKEQTNVHSY